VLVLALRRIGLSFPNTAARPKAKAGRSKVIKELQTVAELTRREIKQRPPAHREHNQVAGSVTELGDQLTKNLYPQRSAQRLASVSDKLKDNSDLSKDPG